MCRRYMVKKYINGTCNLTKAHIMKIDFLLILNKVVIKMIYYKNINLTKINGIMVASLEYLYKVRNSFDRKKF